MRGALALVLLAAAAAPATAAELTPEQVECDARRLGALVERLEVETPDPASPAQMAFVTFSNRHGFFQGTLVGMPWSRAILVSVAPIPPEPETLLSFHLNPDVREHLVNPKRTPLPQVSLTREISTSNLVLPGDLRAVTLSVDPTLEPRPGGPGDLVIDNLAVPPVTARGFRPADTKPGRGLRTAGLTEACHAGFDPVDLHVFALLQRVLRVELADFERLVRYEVRAAVYRDASPGHYRVDLYWVEPESGAVHPEPIRLSVEARADERGVLGVGEVEIHGILPEDLPPGRVEGTVRIVEPVFPGHDVGYEAHVELPIVATPAGAPGVPGVPLFAPFDWGLLLADTAWNGPVALPSPPAVPRVHEEPDFGVPLTEAEVACNREQLDALLDRMALQAGPSPSETSRSLLVTYSNRFGFYEGLAVRTDWTEPQGPAPAPPLPETLLSFHLNPSVRRLLLNPERPPLDQVSLTREPSTSSLVPAGDPRAMTVRIDPTLSPEPGGAGDLVIDGLAAPGAGPGFLPADTRPGRGLTRSGLTEPCHTRFTDFDRRMFAILQRVVRADPVDLEEDRRLDSRIALYRDTDPGSFLADVRAYDPFSGQEVGRARTRLVVTADAAHQLGEGSMELLGVSTAPPPPGGRLWLAAPTFRGGRPGLFRFYPILLNPPDSPAVGIPPPTSVPVEWELLLRETAWNPAIRCGHGTAEEIAATPRADENTELLALAMGNGLTADGSLYQRLVEELAEIRELEPAVAGVPFFPTRDGRSLRLVVTDDAVAQAILDGEYEAARCLDAWYELEEVVPAASPPVPGLAVFELRFEGLYDLDVVAADYAALPGIDSAEPLELPLPAAPAGTLPSLCAELRPGGSLRYFFDVPSGAGPARTYHFQVSPGFPPELVGIYDPFSLAPPPDWLPRVAQCYESLRFGARL